ncbi:MAG: hypothetical protein ABI639_08485 [Thermoanaerobaculia bacterium]
MVRTATLNRIQSSSPELFRSCSAADADSAWSEFVGRFHLRLTNAVRRMQLRLGFSGSIDDRVEDLVQEVYFRLLSHGRRHVRRFRGENEAQLMTYLQRVASSVVVDAHRGALAGKRWGGRQIAMEDWLEIPPSRPGSGDGAEALLLAAERRREFLKLCREALGRRGSAMTLRIARLAFLEGWTSREIAHGLGGRVGITAVDSVIYRLRRNLAARGFALPRRDRRTSA